MQFVWFVAGKHDLEVVGDKGTQIAVRDGLAKWNLRYSPSDVFYNRTVGTVGTDRTKRTDISCNQKLALA